MPTLPSTDIDKIRNGIMRWWSNLRETTGLITKTELRAAIVATDAWVDANAASYNNALPVIFRNNASLQQKSLLLIAVILMRFNLGMLKRLFPEVD